MVALMATGISFPENVFAASEGMDGLPSVVNSGIGKMVDKAARLTEPTILRRSSEQIQRLDLDVAMEVDHGITNFA